MPANFFGRIWSGPLATWSCRLWKQLETVEEATIPPQHNQHGSESGNDIGAGFVPSRQPGRGAGYRQHCSSKLIQGEMNMSLFSYGKRPALQSTGRLSITMWIIDKEKTCICEKKCWLAGLDLWSWWHLVFKASTFQDKSWWSNTFLFLYGGAWEICLRPLLLTLSWWLLSS